MAQQATGKIVNARTSPSSALCETRKKTGQVKQLQLRSFNCGSAGLQAILAKLTRYRYPASCPIDAYGL
jgi:hypothetical protein